MRLRGDLWDNAVVEPFHGNLKEGHEDVEESQDQINRS
jgi:hypothetical protein